LYDPVWTSSVKASGDFAIALIGFVLLMAWRAPPLVVVVTGALGGGGLAPVYRGASPPARGAFGAGRPRGRREPLPSRRIWPWASHFENRAKRCARQARPVSIDTLRKL